MTNLINPLHHVYMKQFRQYVAGRGGKVCAIVQDGDGSTYTIGDRKYLLTKMKELDANDRRKSREWIPSDRSLPLLPMPLSELITTAHTNKMKSVASAYVNHFLEAGQKLGTVNNRKLTIPQNNYNIAGLFLCLGNVSSSGASPSHWVHLVKGWLLSS